MNFALTPEQEQIQAAIERVCEPFDADYWLKKDQEGGFPHDFHQALAESGWLGIAMPEEYGGAGLGISEAALMMHTISATGAGLSGASAVHMNIFGLHPVVVFGTDEQKKRWLPPLIQGKDKACFGVTEPNAGLNTLKLQTRAVREGGHYVVHGQKVFISTAQVANKILLLTRTRPAEECKGTEGLTLFYTDLDRSKIDVHAIEKLGRKCVDTNQLFIDGLRIPVEDRVGEEGKGFSYILHGMNPERILIAAEAVGLGRAALARAAGYAAEREVFGRPIGKNQGVQHPLARSWAELEAANHMIFAAASLYDKGQPCGSEANAAKLLASEACMNACQTSILTHGGFGYAKEYHVERFMREAWIGFIAPVTPQLILSNIAERKLGLPKSY